MLHELRGAVGGPWRSPFRERTVAEQQVPGLDPPPGSNQAGAFFLCACVRTNGPFGLWKPADARGSFALSDDEREAWLMSLENEAVVWRFYEQMCNEGKNELADELFTADHVLHDPQILAGTGPQGVAEVVATYQNGVDGHWGIEEMFSARDRVVVRWTGSGTHIGEINGIPPTGRAIRVDALSIHRLDDGKIAETWEIWDTLGFLQQIGVVPAE